MAVTDSLFRQTPWSFGARTIPFILLLAISAPVVWYSLLMPGIQINDDMFQEYLSAGIFRHGVLQEGVFTLWTPMVGGGYPIFAHPHEASFVFPFWPAVLAFGEVAGVRLNILLIYITGVIGMYFLAMQLPGIRGNRRAAWLATLFYAACPFFVETVTSGNFNELMSFTMPAIAFAGIRGVSSRRWFAIAVMLIAFIGFFGKYSFPYVMFLVAAGGCWFSWQSTATPAIRRRLLARVLALVLLSAGVAAVKLIPMVELILSSEYEVEGAGLHALQPKYYIPLVWFLLALLLSWRFEAYRLWVRPVFRILVVTAVAALALLNVGLMAMGIDYADVPETQKRPAYYQIQGSGLPTDGMRTENSNGYLNFLRGVATVDWFDDWISIPTRVVPKHIVNNRDVVSANPAWVGEAWLKDSSAGSVISVAAEANRIDVVVDLVRPTALELNWNFHDGWRSDSGVVNSDGLIAIEGLESGISRISLRFFPLSLSLGLLAMTLSLAASVLLRPVREAWIRPGSRLP